VASKQEINSGPTLRRNRDFRFLFSAQIISLLGSGVTTVGLALFAYQLTGGASATAVIGNALTLRILAFLLFSQPAGVIADRISKKRILIAADLIRFGRIVSVVVHFQTEPLPWFHQFCADTVNFVPWQLDA